MDDDYSELVKTGTKVYVGLDNENLPGVIGSVNPVIRDRMIEFDVNLQESNHFKLRPNLTVDLNIVRAERDSVLRISNGPAIGRGREHQVYVINKGGAVLLDIQTGLKSADYVEVLEGLSEGDRVVISDISSADKLDALELQ